MPRKIYISSTFSDLQEFRRRTDDGIEFLRGYFETVRIMEYMMPGGGPPLSECLADVADCDIYVLIIGKRYGSIEPTTGKSYTENEYLAARGKKIILPFIADESAPALANIPTDNPAEFARFRDMVQTDNTTFIKGFTSPDHILSQLLTALYRFSEKKWPPLREAVRYSCDRVPQCLDFKYNKKTGNLNLITLACKSWDQASYFTKRMAVYELGLSKEFIKPFFPVSLIGNSASYEKHKARFITGIAEGLVDPGKKIPQSLPECFELFRSKPLTSIFLQMYLSREDAGNPILLNTLERLLPELQQQCISVGITVYLVVIFEFPDNAIVDEGIYTCLTANSNIRSALTAICELDPLEEIKPVHLKEWLSVYVIEDDNQLIDQLLEKYFSSVSSYSMSKFIDSLDEMIKVVNKKLADKNKT